MTEEKLYSYLGKNIKVMCIDGDVVEGFCEVVTKAIDNEPEVAEISLKTDKNSNGLIGITLPEIKAIEIIA